MANPELMTGLGAAASTFLTAAGACYASVHAGVFALRASVPCWVAFSPIIISGVLAIYGIIISVILSAKFNNDETGLTETDGYRYFAAGLSVGLACLASGLGMGKFLEKHTITSSRRVASSDGDQTEPLLSTTEDAPNCTYHVSGHNMWSFLMVLVFLEAIGLYGLIVALFLSRN
jgi:V-type H+-transporting ATPase proteolipid subunit